MNRTKPTIAIFAATLALTSCQQTYTCHCEHIPGTMQISQIRADEEINAPNQSQADDECDEHDNGSTDCSIL